MKKEQIKSYVSWGKKLEVIFDNGLTMSVAFSDFFCPDDPVDNKDLTVSIKSTKTGMNITGCFFYNVPVEHAYNTESVTIKQKDFIELIKSVKNAPVCVIGNDEQSTSSDDSHHENVKISKESVEKFVANDENLINQERSMKVRRYKKIGSDGVCIEDVYIYTDIDSFFDYSIEDNTED